MNETDAPQPVSLEDAQRIWTLQKQKMPLETRDQELLEQAYVWQMWVSHGMGHRVGRSHRHPVQSPQKIRANPWLFPEASRPAATPTKGHSGARSYRSFRVTPRLEIYLPRQFRLWAPLDTRPRRATCGGCA